MSKITNLIGTTWRLGDKSFDGIIAEQAQFNIDAVGAFTIANVEDGAIAEHYEDMNCSLIALGYTDGASGLTGKANSVTGIFSLSGQTAPFELGTYQIGMIDNVPLIAIVTYEFTITGGEDVNNPLFVDFINTYGTLVSGGEPPTADSVKSHLQSLLTASNAKTGKSDTNLTDAVKTLIEGYGQGGGECSGNHIIEVDELPTENIDENALYKVGDSYYKVSKGNFKDIIAVADGTAASIVELYAGFGITFELHYVEERPTENISPIGNSVFPCYYVENENDILAYAEENGAYQWISFQEVLGMTNCGAINDISEATVEGGYYALVDGGTVGYIRVKGSLTFTENGVYDVTNVKSAVVAIPDKPVSYFIPRTTEELPTDAPEGSIALVFRRE